MESKDIQDIILSAEQVISKANSLHQLLREVKPQYFGGEGILTRLTNSIKNAEGQEAKRSIGQTVKTIRDAIEAFISKREDELKSAQIREKLAANAIDGSVSTPLQPRGSIHPVTFVAKEILDIFAKYGCSILSGPEIETTWRNFDALNVLADHPARNMQDTFYLEGKEKDGEHYLLRTHTTAIDIEALSNCQPPFKAVAFGKTFRRDMDKTHSPMFHQVDFLSVAEDINIGHLKSVIIFFLKEFFNTDKIDIRMRPSFFPFTEPSMEVDVRYSIQNQKITLDPNGDRYMEILGCGVLRQAVLRNCNIDPSKHVAIAAGIGVERMAMLKYGIEDIREFYHSDVAWLDAHSLLNNI